MFFDLLSVLFGKIFFFTGLIQNKGTFPKPLSPEDEKKYLALSRAGDKEAKEILIKHNMRLVAHVVKKYNGAEFDHYKLGFSNPRYKEGSSRQYLRTNVKDITLSTSGDNVQYYEIDGVRYCHVMDPNTGKPVQTGIMTATVLGPNAALNDAYTTAIMAMGKEKAVEFINSKLSDHRVVFTYDNGGKYEIISNIPADELEILAEDFSLVNTVVDGKIVLVG